MDSLQQRQRLIVVTLFMIFLLTHLTKAQDEAGAGSNDSPSPDNGTASGLCQNTYVATARDAPDGIQVQVQLSSVSATPENDIVTIAEHHFPGECGPNRERCNIRIIPFEYQVFCLLPVEKENESRGGIAVIEFRSTANGTKLEYIGQFVSPSPEGCKPTQIFYTERPHSFEIFTACLFLSSDCSYEAYYYDECTEYNHIQFVEFSFNADDITTAHFGRCSDELFIHDPETILEFLLVRNQKACGSQDNVFFIDGGYMVQYEVNKQQFYTETETYLGNCTSGMQYYGRNEVVLRCDNGSALIYNPCDDDIVDPCLECDEGVPFPCSSLNTIATLKGDTLTFRENDTFMLPSGDIERAECIGGEDPMFVFTLQNGSAYIQGLTDDHLTKVGSDVCLRSESNNQCLPPLYLSTGGHDVIGVFTESEFVIANLSCRYSPKTRNLTLSFHPDLASMASAKGTHPCECAAEPPTTATTPTETSGVPDVTVVDAETSGSSNDLAPGYIIMIALIVGGFIVLIIAAVAVGRQCHKQRGCYRANSDSESSKPLNPGTRTPSPGPQQISMEGFSNPDGNKDPPALQRGNAPTTSISNPSAPVHATTQLACSDDNNPKLKSAANVDPQHDQSTVPPAPIPISDPDQPLAHATAQPNFTGSSSHHQQLFHQQPPSHNVSGASIVPLMEESGTSTALEAQRTFENDEEPHPKSQPLVELCTKEPHPKPQEFHTEKPRPKPQEFHTEKPHPKPQEFHTEEPRSKPQSSLELHTPRSTTPCDETHQVRGLVPESIPVAESRRTPGDSDVVVGQSHPMPATSFNRNTVSRQYQSRQQGSEQLGNDLIDKSNSFSDHDANNY